jgi:hypothetical protein
LLFFIVRDFFYFKPEEETERILQNLKDDLNMKFNTLYSSEKNNLIDTIKDENQIYRRFTTARKEGNYTYIRTTALGGRTELTDEVQYWLDDNINGLSRREIDYHRKIIKIGKETEIEVAEKLLKKVENTEGFNTRYIKPEDLSAIDVVILTKDDLSGEIWISFPPVKGRKESLGFAVRMTNQAIVSQASNWFDAYLWDSSKELTSTVVNELRLNHQIKSKKIDTDTDKVSNQLNEISQKISGIEHQIISFKEGVINILNRIRELIIKSHK